MNGTGGWKYVTIALGVMHGSMLPSCFLVNWRDILISAWRNTGLRIEKECGNIKEDTV